MDGHFIYLHNATKRMQDADLYNLQYTNAARYINLLYVYIVHKIYGHTQVVFFVPGILSIQLQDSCVNK